MEIKIARVDLSSKPTTLNANKLLDELKEGLGDRVLYLDRDSSHKDVLAFGEKLKSKGFSVYTREIRYGLDEKDYLYEVHIL